MARAAVCAAAAAGLVAAAAGQPLDLDFDKSFNFGGYQVIPEDFLNGLLEFTPSSECGIKYLDLPWGIQCEVGLNLNINDNANNEDTPLSLIGFAGAALDANILEAGDRFAALDVNYGVMTPELNLGDFLPDELQPFIDFVSNLLGLDQFINFPSQVFPPGASDSFDVNISLGSAKDGFCIIEDIAGLNLPDGLFPEVQAAIAIIDGVADVIGADICVKLEGLDFEDFGGGVNGTDFKFLITFHLFDDAKMDSELPDKVKEVIVLVRNALLQREEGFVFEINLGKLILDNFVQRASRAGMSIRAFNINTRAGALQLTDNAIREDGTFQFRSNPNAGKVTDSPLFLPVILAAGAVVLAGVGAAVVVRVRRNRAAAPSQRGQVTAVSNNKAFNPNDL